MNNKLPNHIGLIMDGNGRYAQKLGKPRSYGHQKGAQNLKKLCKYIYKKKIKYLSIYAFSTENFNRPPEEVDYLMNLFVKMFTKELNFLKNEGVKVIFSGKKDNLSKDVLNAMKTIIKSTQNNQKAVLNICLNYGSQDEIVDMVKQICNKVVCNELSIKDINKEEVSKNLYHNLPPLDLVIRTSGEQRLSNFMLWQSAYAEFYFPECNFPEFDEQQLDKALEVYANRDRRFGLIKEVI